MGRHKEARDLDPYSSPIRLRAERRGRLAVLALGAVSYASAIAAGAVLALVAYAFMLVSGDVQRSEDVELHYDRPQPLPTQSYDGAGFEAPSKTSRIIMQNPSCWIGVPGATCGPERTFLGE